MMQEFLILFRGPDGRTLSDDPVAFQAHLQRLNEWIAMLPPDGKLIGGEPLTQHESRTIVARKLVTDGPFIESKELIGGYMRFQAKSWDAATAWAQACPIFEIDGGQIELREIQVQRA